MHDEGSAAAGDLRSPLVLITKSRPPLDTPNGRKGEKTRVNTDFTKQNELRLLRYQMQSVARHMLPHHRVGICLRYQSEKYGTVDVYKHRQTQRAFYGGLMICGSVWACPVCAAKISERRRAELRSAFDQHLASGGYCTMLTLTFSHSKADKLSELLDKLSEATQIFRRGKRSDNLRREIGEIGSIRAFEVTYGANGWHPHIHLLLMHKVEIDPWDRQWMQEQYYDLWEGACDKVGLETSAAHGLKLDDAAEADTYIGKWGDLVQSKWGVDREMTKANSKKGREGSMTPFDFLRVVVEDGDLMYTGQYKEYVSAMHGKRQLYWSRGLKSTFNIDEKTDEEVATEKEEPADRLGGIDWRDWRQLIHPVDRRAYFLGLVELHGWEDAVERVGIKKMIAAGHDDQAHR